MISNSQLDIQSGALRTSGRRSDLGVPGEHRVTEVMNTDEIGQGRVYEMKKRRSRGWRLEEPQSSVAREKKVKWQRQRRNGLRRVYACKRNLGMCYQENQGFKKPVENKSGEIKSSVLIRLSSTDVTGSLVTAVLVKQWE